MDLEPGTYPVILEPPAVGLMLAYLAMTTFNGKAVLEGRSALATRLGQQVMDPRVQIWDDAADPRTIGLPFDWLTDAKLVLTDALIAESLKAKKDAGFDPAQFDEIDETEDSEEDEK